MSFRTRNPEFEQKRRQPHTHKEAFCLMKYRSEDGSTEEMLWNSRDGVTPFCILSRDGKTELKHVEWNNDMYKPYYEPKVGDRVFVDVTRELAEPHLRAYIDACWNGGSFPMCVGYGSKEHAFEVLIVGRTEPGQPYVLEVTEQNIWQFVKTIHEQDLNQVLQSHPSGDAMQLLHDCIAELTDMDSSLEDRCAMAQKAKDYIEKRVGAVHWVTMSCSEGDCPVCNHFDKQRSA